MPKHIDPSDIIPGPKPTRKDFSDLTNERFGRLLVIRFAGIFKHKACWACQCDCGTERIVRANSLKRGLTKSCGCLIPETSAALCITRQTTHGMTGSREYRSWSAMISRCTNQKVKEWKYYGGRGIKVCDRWLHSFENFYEDMGPRPSGMTLDRYPDTNGNYEPSNCQWRTMKQQNRNRRSNRFISFHGETLCYSEWEEKLGFPNGIIKERMSAGWEPGKALTKPLSQQVSAISHG